MFRSTGNKNVNQGIIESAISRMIDYCQTPKGYAVLAAASLSITAFGIWAVMKLNDCGDDELENDNQQNATVSANGLFRPYQAEIQKEVDKAAEEDSAKKNVVTVTLV